MTQTQLEKLEIGERVKWIDVDSDCTATGAKGEQALGSVSDKGYAAITVKWDDGAHTFHYFKMPEDAKTIERAQQDSANEGEDK